MVIRLRKYLYWIWIPILLFSFGCTKKESAQNAPVLVTQIQIDYRHKQDHLLRRYTNTKKIDVILYYLYDLEPVGRPQEDPEQIQEDFCRITLGFSDGKTKIYRQIGNKYLSVDSHPWQKIKENEGRVLYHLVNHIPSD